MSIDVTTYHYVDTREGQSRRIRIEGDGQYTPLADILRRLADVCEQDHICLLDLRGIDVAISTERRKTATSIALNLGTEE
jgi:hypothetical protein